VVFILCIFKDFLFYKNVYIFKDIASDTINQFYPHIVHASQYLRTYGIPKWSFNIGIGQNAYQGFGDPFTLILCLLPKAYIPYGIVYVEIAKIITGGLFFLLFLRLGNFSSFATIIGGLLYSYGGYMILGSTIYIYSTEAVYASLLLYVLEKFLRNGTWYILPLAFSLVGFSLPLYCYMYLLLMVCYCVVYSIIKFGLYWKKIFSILFKVVVLCFLGVLLSSVFLFSNLYQIVESPRIYNDMASNMHCIVSSSLFTISPYQVITAFYRLFSNDIMGTGMITGDVPDFKGYSNYLEAPILYTGLSNLLLLPQLFLFLNKRKKIIYLILVMLVLLALVVPFFRTSFWLFMGSYFRTFSLFVSLVILFMGIRTLGYIDRAGNVNVKLLFVTSIGLLVLLYLPYFKNHTDTVSSSIRNITAIFIVIYSLLLCFFVDRRVKLYVGVAMFLFICIEVGYFSSITINSRQVVSNIELKQRTGLNDYTKEALIFINSTDKSFFRVNKDYNFNSEEGSQLNAPQIQGYHGLTSYASFNERNYNSFLSELRTADTEKKNMVEGTANRPMLQTLLSVKYTLSNKDSVTIQKNEYDSLNSFSNIKVFQNKNYLPLGFCYTHYIPLSEFRKLNKVQKDMMLLEAVVVNDNEIDYYKTLARLSEKNIIPDLSPGIYSKAVSELKKDTVRISSFNPNKITGTIQSSKPELLFFSIPHDNGWHLKVDGIKANSLLVNIGFIGVLLNKGPHTIELNYIPPLMKEGMVVSVIALAVYLFLFFRYRKVKLKS
jgi:hypothetical protein